MSASDIQIGPYEFFNQPNKHKTTLAVINDKQVSMRVYNRQGNVMTNKITDCQDAEKAMDVLSKNISDLINQGWTTESTDLRHQNPQDEAKKSTKVKTQKQYLAAQSSSSILGKRTHAQSIKDQAEQQKPQQQKVTEQQIQSTDQNKKRKVDQIKQDKDEEEKKEEVKVPQPDTFTGCRASRRLADKPKMKYDDDSILNALAQQDANFITSSQRMPQLMLAHNYNPEEHDPTGWLMSEKLDGVRCYWDGDGSLFTRNGNPFTPPDSWVDQLPKGIALDGELWTNRNDFQKIVSIVRKMDKNNQEWQKINFMIFDAPNSKGNFPARMKAVKEALKEKKDNMPNIQVVEQTVCKSKEHLMQKMDQVCLGQGEGLIIKNPKSKYENRRSNNMLKVKRFEDDEAVVQGFEYGSGRCENMMGALLMKDKNGMEFKIGSGFNDEIRMKPPKKGTVVTYKFQGRTLAGKPRFPIFIRVHPKM